MHIITLISTFPYVLLFSSSETEKAIDYLSKYSIKNLNKEILFPTQVDYGLTSVMQVFESVI